MYALLGKMVATPGNQQALADRMLLVANGMHEVAGCRQYFVYLGDGESVWISEFWDSKEAHDASLEIPGTREFISKTKPFIAGFEFESVTPLGGLGPFPRE